jgi:flagellin
LDLIVWAIKTQTFNRGYVYGQEEKIMILNTNIASLFAQNNSFNLQNRMNSSMEKLTTGLRINRAADDASGLAIADKLRTQGSGLEQGVRNANSAIALTQIADGAMSQVSDILDTIKSKLIEASNDTTSAAGRESIRKDISKLLDQVDNIGKDTTYNGIQLLQAGTAVDGGAVAADLTFQIGEKSTNTISVGAGTQVNSAGLGLDALRDLAADGLTKALSQSNQTLVDDALTTLNGWRADYGSTQVQLESAVSNMKNQITNLANAESQIRDVDMAAESANFNKMNIQAQAGAFVLSQANAMQQNVLRLLQ